MDFLLAAILPVNSSGALRLDRNQASATSLTLPLWNSPQKKGLFFT